MSDSIVISWFAKSASPNAATPYRRQFNNLTTDAKRLAISLIQQGIDIGKAIRKARRESK